MPEPTWAEWTPPYATHVKGRFAFDDFDEEGRPREAIVRAECDKCGEKFERRCTSGLFRQHIARFAIQHLHRNPLEEPARK
jgi:hypothetical protein